MDGEREFIGELTADEADLLQRIIADEQANDHTLRLALTHHSNAMAEIERDKVDLHLAALDRLGKTERDASAVEIAYENRAWRVYVQR